MKEYNLKQIFGNNIIPNEAFPAGEFLADELKARKVSVKEFANCCGISYENLKAFIHNERDITKEESKQICDALGLSEDFFYGLQEVYYAVLQHKQQTHKRTFIPSLQKITRAVYRYMML